MMRIEDFTVPRPDKGQKDQTLVFEVENDETVTLVISNELAYQLAHKLTKAVERAEGVPGSANGEFYSRFYGMQP